MQAWTKKSKFSRTLSHSVFFKARNVRFIPFLSQWVPHKQSLTWMYHWFHIHPSKLKDCVWILKPVCNPTAAPLSVNCWDYSLDRIFLLSSAEGQSVCWQPCDSIQMEIRLCLLNRPLIDAWHSSLLAIIHLTGREVKRSPNLNIGDSWSVWSNIVYFRLTINQDFWHWLWFSIPLERKILKFNQACFFISML